MHAKGPRFTWITALALLAAFLAALTGCRPDDSFADGVIELPRTGQTTSYAVGDDGDLQSGVAWPSPRFADNGDGTVSDGLTGLMWYEFGDLPDAEWGTAITTLSAQSYAGYDDWRLPNLIELRSLLSAGEAVPSTWLNGLGFANIMDSYYWSSTTCASDPTFAHAVRMGTANGGGYLKTAMRNLLAVRGQSVGAAVELPQTGQTTSYAADDDGELRSGIAWPDPRFRDNGDGTITDGLTGLVWDATANRIAGQWEAALAEANALVLAERDDWRVPNGVEMASLLSLGEGDAVAWLTSVGFTGVQSDPYWTSTTSASNADQAWSFSTTGCDVPTSEPKTDGYYVIAVRGPGTE